jgi:hypothetical protein
MIPSLSLSRGFDHRHNNLIIKFAVSRAKLRHPIFCNSAQDSVLTAVELDFALFEQKAGGIEDK